MFGATNRNGIWNSSNGNGNAVLELEWVGMGTAMIRWEWEGNGNKKVISAHLYFRGPLPGIFLGVKWTKLLSDLGRTYGPIIDA